MNLKSETDGRGDKKKKISFMESTPRNTCDAAFKLKAIVYTQLMCGRLVMHTGHVHISNMYNKKTSLTWLSINM